jgi:hypothetical protein
MDYNINFPRPYLYRKYLSQRATIDAKIKKELKRVKLLLSVKMSEMILDKNLNVADMFFIPTDNLDLKNETKKQLDSISISPKLEGKNISIKTKNAKLIANKKASSDTLTNIPNGTSTIGYNCTIDYVTTLDFQPFSGSYNSLQWYVVFKDIGGNYDYLSDGYSLGDIITVKKPIIQSKINGSWTMNFDMYATSTHPTTSFKVFVEQYIDGRLNDVISTDEVTINFSGFNCINVMDMGLSTTNGNGGYPAIKGGDHGTEPILYINLNSPAPPDGQTVYLSLTGISIVNEEAWLTSGNDQVTIGGGQTQGQWSGFLGSRHVLFTKDIHVKATVNGVAGVSTLRITKN